LNLNQLRVFNAVCDELSVTGAARRLRISQPAVSKQLAELEQTVGVVLVDRLPRGLRLTEAGKLLAAHAQRLFRVEADAEAALAELLGLRAGRLAVGASTTTGNYLLPRVLGDFHLRYPNVSVELVIGNTRTITEAVFEGQLDLGVTEGLVPGEALSDQVLARDELVVVVAAQHPLAQQTPVPLSNLASVPWICRESGSGTRQVVEAAFAERGYSLTPAVTLGSSEAIKAMVALGLGFALLSRHTVELEVQAGHLCVLEVTGLQVQRDLHLLTLRGKHPSAAAAEFQRLLREHYPLPPALQR
jgi:DNA-binding transcriptional LysR family regulator